MPPPIPARLDPAAFHGAFGAVRGWILAEWPGLDPEALDGTGGEAEPVVALVAAHTQQTRALSRRHLAELLALATEVRPAPRGAAPPPAPAAPNGDPVDALVGSLEQHLDQLARQVKADVAPLAVDTARQHLGLVVLLSGGLGLMLGLFLGALGYPAVKAADGAAVPDA